MKTRLAVILVAGLLLGADTKDKKDNDLVQGTWQATEMVRNGEVAPKDETAKVTLVIKDDKYVFKPGDGTEHEGTFKLDPAAKPKALDIMPKDGGKMEGIYTVTETEYKMCISFGERPKEFVSNANNNCILIVMKKAK